MKKWDKEIQKANRYFQKAREHGKAVYVRYQDDRSDNMLGISGLRRVNIFYSNVNTIKQSLFNSLPKPDVSRVHKGDYEDDVARVAALILQRGLTYEVNCAKVFKDAIECAILDKLVPGIGQVWVRFEDPEAIAIDTVYWEDFIYQPARTWELVNWVGRIHHLTKDEFVASYGEEALMTAQGTKNRVGTTLTPKEITDDTYEVYEIWDRKDKKVRHICVGADDPLKELDDPYRLPDFYPCPKPLIANPTTASYLPITDYSIAQDQYNELDIIYARMSLITEAVKVAGCYDAASPEIGRMLQGGENKLIPVDDWAMHAETGGSKGLIDWYPVEAVVQVYQALQGQYEAVKSTLYEVTGMSDIMRGASNQYETASAQQIKAQFASVRMNGYQRDVSNFVRDILNIMAGMMCNLYSDEKFAAICGSFSEADQQYLQPAAQLLRSEAMRMYKVDVEADSLTQSDWGLEKSQRMELVGYISQFLTAAVPAIQSVPELGPLMLATIKFSMAGFKGAAEIEGIVDQQLTMLVAKANEPQPEPPPDPEQQKMQLEMQMSQEEAQRDAQKAEQDMMLKQQEAAMKAQAEQMKLAMQQQMDQQAAEHQRVMNAMDVRMKSMELMFKQQEQQMKLEFQEESAEMKREESENGEDESD